MSFEGHRIVVGRYAFAVTFVECVGSGSGSGWNGATCSCDNAGSIAGVGGSLFCNDCTWTGDSQSCGSKTAGGCSPGSTCSGFYLSRRVGRQRKTRSFFDVA